MDNKVMPARVFPALLILLALMSSDSQRVSADDTFAALYKRERASVVYVVSALPDGAASGSGFVYYSDSKQTEVITANHVIEGASRIDVILDGDLTKRYQAEVVTRDHVRDVAVLQIAIGNRTSLQLASPKSVEEGMSIAVIGYPRVAQYFERIQGDDLRPSVHRGTLSAVRLGGEIVQFDATVDHGDSGGPVIDALTGRVVAIVRGAPLDPTYASRGLEQALPGSFYGPSSATIRSVIVAAVPAVPSRPNGAVATTSGSANLAASSASSSVVGAAPQQVLSSPNPNGSSAAYRVGFLNITYTDSATQAIGQTIFERFTSNLQADNSIYIISISFSGAEAATSEQLLGYCQDSRLNAVMYPTFSWRLTGGPTNTIYGTYYTGTAAVEVDLAVTDCAGDVFYVGKKGKSENRYFANRDPNRELTDMANDMTDQLFKDFKTFQAAHQGAWTSLMKYGLALDPSDDTYHAMYQPWLQKSGKWQVFGVFPGGPADKAGLKSRDIIVSINGTPTDNLTPDQFRALAAGNPDLTIVVERPGGNVTLTVHQEQYQQLVSTLIH
jgi:S1-C subfamily serine protease